MKKKSEGTRAAEADIRPEYDFTGGQRGKYADRFAEGSNVVVLDPDVAALFSSSESVNKALRALAELAQQHTTRGDK